MNNSFMLVMNRIPSHALSIFVFLFQRSTLDTKVGLTQQEISRATRLSVETVREGLGWLETPTYQDAALKSEPDLAPFLEVSKYSKAHKITLLPPYVDEPIEVRFTFEDTDARRIGVLEAEVRRLAMQRHVPKISVYLRGEKQSLLAEIEADVGRPITVEEAYLLGGMIESFGPDRVKAAWRRHAHQLPNPIRGVFAMFMNKRFGAKVEQSNQKEEVTYKKITRDSTPV